ncbi:hypothetical protein ACFIJ5_06055 [Haloimpatiens sp. FM7330]|uniref:hypothetical protein n=1 Tax=Haloimpatiens sp. FM7330 TaxID=3298610 RepID=UPI003629578E
MEYYKTFEFKGVKVFISKALTIQDEIYIYKKVNLPFIGTIFGCKGISLPN